MRHCGFMLLALLERRRAAVCAALAAMLALIPFPHWPLRAQGPLAVAALNAAVPSHETLEYSVEWRLVNAGRARLLWNPTVTAKEGRPEWEAKLHLESAGMVSRLFRVNDDYTADIGPNLCAETIFLEAHEGARERETKVTFDPQDRKASYSERDTLKNQVIATHEIEIPACVHEILGGLVMLRVLNLAPGKSTQLAISDGKKSVAVKVESQAREDIKTPLGVKKTIRYEAFVFNNVLYKRPGHLHIWLTDDHSRTPVQLQIRLQFTIGTITLRLEKEDRS